MNRQPMLPWTRLLPLCFSDSISGTSSAGAKHIFFSCLTLTVFVVAGFVWTLFKLRLEAEFPDGLVANLIVSC